MAGHFIPSDHADWSNPLHRDLVRTPNGYIVNPSEAHKYRLDGAESRPH
jgi:hypothetical protein